MNTLKVSLIMVFTFILMFTGCAKKQTIEPEANIPTPEPTETAKRYVVKKGDTLWGISGAPSIYGDPFQWPLIFKTNRDQIQDPDLIETNQEFEIKTDFSSSEKTEAIQKAKDTPAFKPHQAPRSKLPLKY